MRVCFGQAGAGRAIEARNLGAPWNDWRSEMQIMIAPLLGCLMPVLAVLGLFWALWGCPSAVPEFAGDGSHPAPSKEAV